MPQELEIGVSADDTTLYIIFDGKGNLIEKAKILENGADALLQWGKRWHVDFEPSKSHIMTVSLRKSTGVIPCLIFGDIPVEEVKELKLLGVSFDSRMTFTNYIRSIAKRATSRLAMMMKAGRLPANPRPKPGNSH